MTTSNSAESGTRPPIPITQYIVKVSSSCNLTCSYCHIYNKGDRAWASQPARMSERVWSALLERVRTQCLKSQQPSVRFTFHGGEPTLLGPQRISDWCRVARQRLGDIVDVSFDIQTNGTLINSEWVDVFLEHSISVGVSMDGPRHVHDAFRVDLRGRGSYDRVAKGLEVLKAGGLPFGILSVVQPGADSVATFRHFVSLGCNSIGYLLPAETYETVASIRAEFGATPCADYLVPVFDEWWSRYALDIRVREFWNMARLVMGGPSQLDTMGNPALPFLVVQPDGSVEGLDKLRVCEPSLVSMGATVMEAEFADIIGRSFFHSRVMSGPELPGVCQRCPEALTCGGGYLPNRYSRARGFDNPSVWCEDLLALFVHARRRLDVTPDETRERRAVLESQSGVIATSI